MQCPVCKDTQLTMSNRENVEIDYCPQCRGVWLDRGELDKIIERSQRETVESAQSSPQPAPAPQQPAVDPRAYGNDYGYGGGHGSRRGSHHGSFLKRLFD